MRFYRVFLHFSRHLHQWDRLANATSARVRNCITQKPGYNHPAPKDKDEGGRIPGKRGLRSFS